MVISVTAEEKCLSSLKIYSVPHIGQGVVVQLSPTTANDPWQVGRWAPHTIHEQGTMDQGSLFLTS